MDFLNLFFKGVKMKEKEELKELDLTKVIKSILDKTQEIFKKEESETQSQRLNILILGKTGVGKSTLINCVFGEELVKAGQGEPVTQEIQCFTKDNKLFIYDTPGLELTREKTDQIKDFVGKQESKSVDEQIHIAWYCINEASRRVEETEEELYKLLKTHKFQTLIVITKAMQDKDDKGEKFSDVVKEKFKIDEVFRVRALEIEDDEGDKKSIMGIKELINKSYLLLPEGQKAAFARKQKFDEKMRKEQCTKDAKALINKYSLAAGGVSASPIPFSDIAVILPTQIAMIIHISKTYGLEFDWEGAKKVALALLGVCGVGFGVRAVVGNVLKFIPGIGSVVGGAINATVATITTRAMGETYLAWLNDNFENILKDIVDFDNINFGQYQNLAKSILKEIK